MEEKKGTESFAFSDWLAIGVGFTLTFRQHGPFYLSEIILYKQMSVFSLLEYFKRIESFPSDSKSNLRGIAFSGK